MNWIKNFVRPKISGILGTKRDVPENMWVKCPETGEMVFYRDLEANQFVIPRSGYHMRMAPEARLKHTFDDKKWIAFGLAVEPRKLFLTQCCFLERLRQCLYLVQIEGR